MQGDWKVTDYFIATLWKHMCHQNDKTAVQSLAYTLTPLLVIRFWLID